MEKRLKVSINDKFHFEFSDSEIQGLDVLEISPNELHLLIDQKSFSARINNSDFSKKSYSVQVNSNPYEIVISNELDQLIDELGLSDVVSGAIKDIKAPMPGLILEVNVEEGEKVSEGDYLLVLEAMKMENTIMAPRDGIVKSLMVKKGETVKNGQLLIEME